jgi:8-oxo-dGTP diphosphatase
MQNKNSDIKIAVDAIVFGYSKQDGVSILLIQRKYEPYKNGWAIPGGFVLADEALETAVKRELLEETGIKVNYLEQLYTFGEPNRDPRQRVIAVAYFGMVKTGMYQELKASTDAANAKWFNIKQLPTLAFDHKQILQVALERLKAKIRYQPIGFELLDKTFPFSDLEKLYAALLDKELNRRNFSKKILSFDFLEETGKLSKPDGKGRPSKMYQFNQKRYTQLLKEGFHFEI